MTEIPESRLRLDLFLYRTRFFKTRGMASDSVQKRGVRITRQDQTRRVSKPGTTISPGDVLSFTRAKVVVTLEVLDVPTRRGPAAEAGMCFALLPDNEA